MDGGRCVPAFWIEQLSGCDVEVAGRWHAVHGSQVQDFGFNFGFGKTSLGWVHGARCSMYGGIYRGLKS